MPLTADLDLPIEPDHFLAVTVSRPASGVAVVLHLEGHLDHDTVPVLRQRLAPFLGHGRRALVFDLAKLERMTSPGLGAFLNVRRTQEKTGGPCLFVNVPPRIRRVLDIMDAVPSADLFASVRELDDYLLALQRREGDGEDGDPDDAPDDDATEEGVPRSGRPTRAS